MWDCMWGQRTEMVSYLAAMLSSLQGDPSGWLQPPVGLVPSPCLGSRVAGSYSSGPPADGTVGTMSTRGLYQADVSPCTSTRIYPLNTLQDGTD